MPMKSFYFLLIPLSAYCGDMNLLDSPTLHQIGLQVWQNECRGTVDGLVSWNAGEEFPSLGLGHFIWYPEGASYPFEETFPKLIAFLKAREVELPSWIAKAKGCPWKTRDEFLQEKRSKKVVALRDLLTDTIDLQILFLYERFQEEEKKLVPSLKPQALSYLQKLKETPQGIYALMDYTHFKGTGLSAKERYAGEGWGLLQVLQTMDENIPADALLTGFVTSAKKVLAKRVRSAPLQRHEEQWLNGWYKRLETYTSTKASS